MKKPADPPDENPCFECGGRCCSFEGLNIHFGEAATLDELIEQYDEEILRRPSGKTPNMQFFLEWDKPHRAFLRYKCEHLTDDGLCEIYDDRPDICRSWQCPVLRGEESVEEFTDRVEPSEKAPLVDVTSIVRKEFWGNESA